MCLRFASIKKNNLKVGVRKISQLLYSVYNITTELDLLKESYWRTISAIKVQNSGDQTRWDRYDKNRIVLQRQQHQQ